MVDVYVGNINCSESIMQFEFNSFKEASDFCDILMEHYKEERKKMYLAVERRKEMNDGEVQF